MSENDETDLKEQVAEIRDATAKLASACYMLAEAVYYINRFVNTENALLRDMIKEKTMRASEEMADAVRILGRLGSDGDGSET